MNQSTIRKIGTGRDFIEAESLTQLQSVMAIGGNSKCSDKYQPINTYHLVKLLEKENWFPVLAQENRVNKEDLNGFQKHMIRFRSKDAQALTKLNDLSAEIILTNSHDRSSAYTIMAGFFRLVCLNGLIVSEANFGAIKIKHIGFNPQDVVEASYKVIKEVPQLVDKVNLYRETMLSPKEREILAESAILMKFDPSDEDEISVQDGFVKINDRAFATDRLLSSRRSEDDASLWGTFNTIQEKFQKGNNFESTYRTNDEGQVIHRTKVKGLTSINENLRINKGLWHLMEQMRIAKDSGSPIELR